jgi:hypothetical protein
MFPVRYEVNFEFYLEVCMAKSYGTRAESSVTTENSENRSVRTGSQFD